MISFFLEEEINVLRPRIDSMRLAMNHGIDSWVKITIGEMT